MYYISSINKKGASRSIDQRTKQVLHLTQNVQEIHRLEAFINRKSKIYIISSFTCSSFFDWLCLYINVYLSSLLNWFSTLINKQVVNYVKLQKIPFCLKIVSLYWLVLLLPSICRTSYSLQLVYMQSTDPITRITCSTYNSCTFDTIIILIIQS